MTQMGHREQMRELLQHYQHMTQMVAGQLALETANHHLTSGTSREIVWLNVFRQLLPKKYVLAQGAFIIDSFGHISAEVDIAIYDEQYMPYIFNYGNILFIPIEAVAIAVQCKSKTLAPKNLTKWVKTIQQLKTDMNAYTRIIPGVLDTKLQPSQTQTATRPIIILCTTHDLKKTKKYLNEYFDITLYLDSDNNLVKRMKSSLVKLDEWYKVLNHYGADATLLEEITKKIPTREFTSDVFNGNVLLSLKFELNQLLMLINNPMFFPHASYVRMFNDALKFQRKDEVDEK